MMLLDIAIFIDFLRARPEAGDAVIRARALGAVVMHAFVAAELILGARDRSEMRRALALISTCELLVPDESDLRRGLGLLERHRLASGMGWNDCVIAATALRLGWSVVTLNDKHFIAFAGLQVVRPY